MHLAPAAVRARTGGLPWIDRIVRARTGAERRDRAAVLELGGRLLALLRSGERVAVATTIDVIGSAPQPAGTSMAVTSGGAVLGSVSAGCVESGVLDACGAVLEGGPARVLRYGFGEAGGGLSCGGELDVLVHLATGAVLEQRLQAVADGRDAAVGLVVAGPPRALGALVADHDGGVDGLEPRALARLRAAVVARARTGRRGMVEAACGPSVVRAFVDVVGPAPRLVIAGATETAVALATIAVAAGWAVTVVDPRPPFAVATRFPSTCRLVVARADVHLAAGPLGPRDAVCLLGHDEDLDPLAIAVALEHGAGYVGALGSRATAARRRERLRALGLPDGLADRLHAPIGLDLGAATPMETAVSILAELIAARSGGTGRPLADLDGPIHRSGSALQEAPDPIAGHGQLRRP